MTDGLAASVFGSTAHPPRSHSCEEGPSRREHGQKEVTSVPTSRPARQSHGKSSPRWGWFGTWRGRGRGLGLLSGHSPAREFGAQLQAPSKMQTNTDPRTWEVGGRRAEPCPVLCAWPSLLQRAPKIWAPTIQRHGCPSPPKGCVLTI